ncbi:hypothetical protein F66182_941 [Fusarium sp. NRRL 66182]|nr:hypothetical protein F66182_941 [Fusarium sp. NRRL 66182]
MAPIIDTLPSELLDQIFRDINNAENGRSTIACCSRVSRRLRDYALPHLYQSLVLVDGDQIDQFLSCHDCQAITSTRHLTLGLIRDEHIPRPSKTLDRRIRRLAEDVVVFMEGLESFSFKTTRTSSAAISVILKALPTSCVNLEFDVVGACNDNDPVHLCEALRHLLPRMQDFRVEMRPVCDAMLGTWDSDDVFHPVYLPHIRKLQIRCPDDYIGKQCSNRRGAGSWTSYVQALQHVADLERTKAAEFTVFAFNQYDYRFPMPVHETIFRCHVRGGQGETTTWAFPFASLPRRVHHPGRDRSKDAHYIRTDLGKFVTHGKEALFSLAEGRPWRATSNGARLPATLATNAAWVSDEELGIFTEKDWRERFDPMIPYLWDNERKAGAQLLCAEERRGVNWTHVAESTPEGWIRPREKWYGARIFREDEDYLNPLPTAGTLRAFRERQRPALQNTGDDDS